MADARSMRGDPDTDPTRNATQDRAPTIGGQRSETRFSFREREDDNVGLPSAILASGASNGTQDRAPTIGGQRSETRFSFRERGRQRRTPKRDPRERSE